MENKKSTILLIAFALGALYTVYLLAYFGGIVGDSAGGALATAIVMPHMLFVLLATVFDGLGYFMNKRSLALVGGIMFIIALILFFPYFMFVIVQLVLSFVAFAKMKA